MQSWEKPACWSLGLLQREAPSPWCSTCTSVPLTNGRARPPAHAQRVSAAFKVVQIKTVAISSQFPFSSWKESRSLRGLAALPPSLFGHRKTSPGSSCHLAQAGASQDLYLPSSTSTKAGGFADYSLSHNTIDFSPRLALTYQNTHLSYWWLLWAPQKGKE